LAASVLTGHGNPDRSEAKLRWWANPRETPCLFMAGRHGFFK
jgi:hypothetical protein